MRDRRLLVLAASAVAIVAFGVYGVMAAPGAVVASPSPRSTSTEESRPDQKLTLSDPAPVTPTPVTPTLVTPTPQDGPGQAGARYLTAWQSGDLATMADLVADPPADFADRHRRFDADLRASLSSSPPASCTVKARRPSCPSLG